LIENKLIITNSEFIINNISAKVWLES